MLYPIRELQHELNVSCRGETLRELPVSSAAHCSVVYASAIKRTAARAACELPCSKILRKLLCEMIRKLLRKLPSELLCELLNASRT